MTMNDKLERNLLKLFSNFKDKDPKKPEDQDYFIEQIVDGSITIEEKEKKGEGQVTFSNCHFLRKRKLKEFCNTGRCYMDFPFFLSETVHKNYRKKNIKISHLCFGDTFDMQKAFMI